MSERRAVMFIDGEFLNRVNDCFRRYRQRSPLLPGQMRTFVQQQIEQIEDIPVGAVRLSEIHFFRGHVGADDLDPETLREEWQAQHQLVEAGVILHYFPMGFANTEKGVDVALAIAALEAASAGAGLIVLVSGDADYVPMVGAVQAKGVPVLVVGFDAPPGEQREGVGTSRRLYSEARYSVRLEQFVEAEVVPVAVPAVTAAMVALEPAAPAPEPVVTPTPQRVAGIGGHGERRGVISRLIDNYGFIDDSDNPGSSWFFHASCVDNDGYRQLGEGDAVAFVLGPNPRGNNIIAIEVRKAAYASSLPGAAGIATDVAAGVA